MGFSVPILLVAWRRPNTLIKVIEAIRSVAPTRMFVACDGPNPEHTGEADKVFATRQVLEREIDWPCQIERLYSDVNQGCRLGVSRAITWFFDQVEEGIILEDDCVPHPDFLQFCQEALSMYQNNTRVWQICGTKFIDPQRVSHGQGHFFSRYGPIWGWATWRRAWRFYDCNLAMWPEMRLVADSVYIDKYELKQKVEIGDRLHSGVFDTWDYQWAIIKAFHGALNVIPDFNLVQNIGIGDDATHTKDSEQRVPKIDKYSRIDFPMQAYPFAIPNAIYDSLYAKAHFYPESVLIRVARRVAKKFNQFKR